MQKNRAMWVALIVLAFATVLMIFVVLPAIDDGKSVSDIAGDVGDAAKKAGETVNEAVSEVTGDANTATDSKIAPDVAPVPTQASGTPVFDILRVEKDGSMVIAGKAAPGGKLDVMDSETMIASVNVGADGDFVAVLETPLTPGDHEITLRVTGKDGTALTSQEVATVSVPKDASGDLLAMVTKPGQASRVISAPQAGVEIAAAETPALDAAGGDAKATPLTAPVTIDGLAIPALPDGSAGLAGSAPMVGGAMAATQQALPADAAVSTQPVAKLKAAPEVQVSAVEIEGDRIFVAGGAKPGSTVRIYADNKFIGEAKVDQTGRFVVDNTLSLPVGGHAIRADVLSADGSRVEFRASVPFDRPAGEQLAVVADPAAELGSGAAMVPIDTAKFEKAKGDASKALALLNGLFANGKTPGAEELAAARSASEIALKTLSEMKVKPTDTEATGVAGAATKAFGLLKGLANDADAVREALVSINAVVPSLLPARPAVVADATIDAQTAAPVIVEPAAEPTTNEPAPAQPMAEGAATKAMKPVTMAETTVATSEPKIIEQATLKPSRSSVIIRRGDTLWQISRRVYGQGVRYTTIYIANQDQIADPDRILPGQIFGVPETPLPNAEEIHRKQLKKHGN